MSEWRGVGIIGATLKTIDLNLKNIKSKLKRIIYAFGFEGRGNR